MTYANDAVAIAAFRAERGEITFSKALCDNPPTSAEEYAQMRDEAIIGRLAARYSDAGKFGPKARKEAERIMALPGCKSKSNEKRTEAEDAAVNTARRMFTRAYQTAGLPKFETRGGANNTGSAETPPENGPEKPQEPQKPAEGGEATEAPETPPSGSERAARRFSSETELLAWMDHTMATMAAELDAAPKKWDNARGFKTAVEEFRADLAMLRKD